MNKPRISDSILAFGFSLILLLSLLNTIAIVFNVSDVLIYTLVLTVLYSIMAWFKKLSLGLTAAAVLFVVFFWKSSVFASFVSFIGDFYQWIWGLQGSYEDPDSAFIKFSLLLFCIAISLPMFLLIKNNAHMILPLFIGVVVFFSQQLLALPFYPALFWVYIFFTVVYAVRQAMPRTEKSELMLLMSVPFCLLLLWATILMPVSEEPAGTPVAAAVNRSLNGLPDWLNFDWITGPFSGPWGKTVIDYGDVSGDLGGEVRLGDSTVLFLRGSRPVYLKSRSYITYNGRRWEAGNRRTQTEDEFMAPLAFEEPFFLYYWIDEETDFQYSKFPYENWQMLLFMYMNNPRLMTQSNMPYEIESMSVHYWDISTDKIYSPHLAVDYQVASEFEGDKRIFKQWNSDVISDSYLEKDFSYTVKAIRPNLTHAELASLYRLSYPGFWSDNPSAVSPAISRLASYSANVARVYTELSDTLTQRTFELAYEITADKDSTYDKALAIESYLRENYTYNTSPPELPDDVDFVDHFLFEGKEGYCTYFATAMTILCRSVRIPARYVEGYAPSSMMSEDFYVITGRQAHAWVEVYLEGAGWVPFEPTSSYLSESIRLQQVAAEPSSSPSSELPVEVPQLPDLEEDDIPPPTLPETPDEVDDDSFRLYPFFYVLAALFLLLLVQVLRRRLFVRKVDAQRYSGKDIESLYRYLSRVARLLKVSGRPHETPIEFGNRVDGKYPRLKGAMTAASEVYSRVHYGPREPSEKDCFTIHKAYNAMENFAKSELGIKFVLLRYLIGVI